MSLSVVETMHKMVHAARWSLAGFRDSAGREGVRGRAAGTNTREDVLARRGGRLLSRGEGALSELVSALLGDLKVPVALAQHLDPERESNLEEILGRWSTLPVQTVTEHEPLRGEPPQTRVAAGESFTLECSVRDVGRERRRFVAQGRSIGDGDLGV